MTSFRQCSLNNRPVEMENEAVVTDAQGRGEGEREMGIALKVQQEGSLCWWIHVQ